MISADFAPNESWDDVWVSFKLLFQPGRWLKGKEINQAKKKLLEKILHLSPSAFYVSFFLTGRSALYNILKSLNLNPDDEVLVQAFTCEAVILPIVALNLKPVYVDIEEKTFSMNPIDLENKLTKKAKVIILQHTFGITPILRNKILSLIKKHNLLLIEDIAHGVDFSNLKLPSSNACFLLSFGRSKALSSVFGGAIITNDKKLANKLEKINLPYPSYSFIARCLLYKPIAMLIKLTYNIFIGKLIHNLANKLGLIIPEITAKEKKAIYDKSFNKAYPNALSLLLLHQLKKLDQIRKNRGEIGAIYQKKLKKTNISLPVIRNPLIRYPLLIVNRDHILHQAAKKSVFLGQWYNQVVAPKEIPLNRVGYQLGSCPTAEKLCQKIINLPTNINRNQAQIVIKTLNDVINTKV